MFQKVSPLVWLIIVALIRIVQIQGFSPLRSPFRKTSSSLACSSSDDYNDTDDNDYFTKSLQQRLSQASKLPLVFRETLLPRQRLQITIQSGVFFDIIRQRLQEGEPTLGMLGIQRSRELMPRGVQVEILGWTLNEWKTGVRLDLKAQRRIEIAGELEDSLQGSWTQASVRYLDSAEEEASERDLMGLTVAMQQARELTDPNKPMKESKSLVDMWLELAREKEQYSGQIDNLLEELGEMPSWQEPSECALWVGALINPTPAIGVAYDIRQPLLLAATAQERTQIALDALWNSIQRMDPSPRFDHYGNKRTAKD